MLVTTLVSTIGELDQIRNLNQQNLRQSLSIEEMEKEGFVSWAYSAELLQKMHQLAPSIIVKDDDKVVGYALVMPKEASAFHKDLDTMIKNLQPVVYKDKLLLSYNFYLMGQICIHKNYRGRGLFSLMYEEHKKRYSHQYEFLLTEIITSNKRSIKAHEKVGFKEIHTYHDNIGEWSLVVWDWQ
jgi:ribosomal protein S18 acetylase RimI-like enzyme